MLIAVTGGTGTLGREVVDELDRRGHVVRSLSRRMGVDLVTGAGLAGALEGVDAVIDTSNAGPRRAAAESVLVGGTRGLLAAEAHAGVEHHVAISVVGAERVARGYYELKVAQENVVRSAPVPWTIVRATQLHELLDRVFRAAARWGALPGPAVPLQPVAAREVARVLADTVEAEPSGAVTEFAGPEVATVGDLARTWRLETLAWRPVVPVPQLGATGRALRAGALTNPGAWRGRITFAAWLAARAAGAWPRERRIAEVAR